MVKCVVYGKSSALSCLLITSVRVRTEVVKA